MGEATGIQWCDSTSNVMMGCDGCELWNPVKQVRRCYAGNMTSKMLLTGPKRGWPASFNTPTLFLERVDEACRWGSLTGKIRANKPWIPDYMPRIIFVGDMGDIFSNGLPEDWLVDVIKKFADAEHIFMLLTKRPSKMREFFDRVECPENVWCGTTLTGQQNRRIEELTKVRCKTKFLSIEPQWESITLPVEILELGDRLMVINGGESGDAAKPYLIKWGNELAEQCNRWGVRFFMKQLGACPIGDRCKEACEAASVGLQCSCVRNEVRLITLKDKHGGNWDEWPDECRLLRRREFPNPNVYLQKALI